MATTSEEVGVKSRDRGSVNKGIPSHEQRKARILCLDGGGVKGVSSLRMLQKIMEEVKDQEQLKQPRELSNDSQPDRQSSLKPCNYFDLICGTSTGGLIALMLGRLEYTVEEAIDQYLILGKDIFKKKLPWWSRWDAQYDHKPLEDGLKKIVEEARLEPQLEDDAPLKDNTRRCKTFVITTTIHDHSAQPTILRSYDIKSDNFDSRRSYGIDRPISSNNASQRSEGNDSQEPDDSDSGELEYVFTGTILEAGRATSAAPTYFKSITLSSMQYIDGRTAGPKKYSDGGTIANNPCSIGIVEACRLWGWTGIDCIVSLGTGLEEEHTLENAPLVIMGPWGLWFCENMLPPSLLFKTQLAFYSLQALTSTERGHQHAKDLVGAFRSQSVGASRRQPDTAEVGESDASFDEVYFRLNVSDKRSQVGLDAWEKMGELMELAETFMKEEDAKISKKVVAERLLRGDISKPPPKRTQDSTSLRRPFQFRFIPKRKKSPGAAWKTSDFVLGNGELDFTAKHNFVCKSLAEELGSHQKAISNNDIRPWIKFNGQVYKPEILVTPAFLAPKSGLIRRENFYVVDNLPEELDFIVGFDIFLRRESSISPPTLLPGFL